MANVAVAEAPTRMGVPEQKINANVIGATLLGLVLVVGAALFGGMRRREAFTPWELEGLTGAPVLGAIPLLQRRALPQPPGAV
jgi:LPXTG-motif cell wall-anchored protein